MIAYANAEVDTLERNVKLETLISQEHLPLKNLNSSPVWTNFSNSSTHRKVISLRVTLVLQVLRLMKRIKISRR